MRVDRERRVNHAAHHGHVGARLPKRVWTIFPERLITRPIRVPQKHRNHYGHAFLFSQSIGWVRRGLPAALHLAATQNSRLTKRNCTTKYLVQKKIQYKVGSPRTQPIEPSYRPSYLNFRFLFLVNLKPVEREPFKLNEARSCLFAVNLLVGSEERLR